MKSLFERWNSELVSQSICAKNVKEQSTGKKLYLLENQAPGAGYMHLSHQKAKFQQRNPKLFLREVGLVPSFWNWSWNLYHELVSSSWRLEIILFWDNRHKTPAVEYKLRAYAQAAQAHNARSFFFFNLYTNVQRAKRDTVTETVTRNVTFALQYVVVLCYNGLNL